jgi:hypothetical protein
VTQVITVGIRAPNAIAGRHVYPIPEKRTMRTKHEEPAAENAAKQSDDSQMDLDLLCPEGECMTPVCGPSIDDPTMAINQFVAEQTAREKKAAPDLAAQEGDPDGMKHVDTLRRLAAPVHGAEETEDDGVRKLVDDVTKDVDDDSDDDPPEPEGDKEDREKDDAEEDDEDCLLPGHATGYPIPRAAKVNLAPALRRKKADGLVFADDLVQEGLGLLRAVPPGDDWVERMPARAKVCGARKAVELVYAAQFRTRAQTLTLIDRSLEELDCGNVVGAVAYVEVASTLIRNRLASWRKTQQRTSSAAKPMKRKTRKRSTSPTSRPSSA